MRLIIVSGTERYHTIDTASWPVESALSVLVNYYHQYKPSVTLVGVNLTHNVITYHQKDGSVHNDPGTFGLWSDWCDEGISLSFDIEASGSSITERWHTYEDFMVMPWSSVSTAFSVTVVYSHQFNVSITTTGLVSSYPATITATQAGNPIDPTTYTSWNDWVDADSTLSIDETITVSSTERYHTVDIASWVVDSAITPTVDYHHQYKPTITLVGTDGSHTVGAVHTKDGAPHDDTEIYASWSDWADEGYELTFDEHASGYPRRSTTDTRSWIVDSAFTATIIYVATEYITYTITKNPLQGNITVDDIEYIAPALFNWLPGSIHNISAVSPENGGVGKRYSFNYWDDGGAQSHTIIVNTTNITITAFYRTQYKPMITLVGLDETHTVGVVHSKGGLSHNDTDVYDSWSDWADEGSELIFDEYSSGHPQLYTTDTRSWVVDSAFTAAINYTAREEVSEEETNHKPLIALIFCIILIISGIATAYKRPLKLSIQNQISKDRLYTGLFIILPFIVAESLTGVISILTGALSVPPILGVGMILDLALLIAGLAAFAVVYLKSSWR